jgi:hypothetical protein
VNLAGEGPNSAEASASPVAMAAWFRTDALTNLSNGARVAIWPDASGAGFDAVQALVANQPTFMTGVINGQPVVRFNAANSSYLWFHRPMKDDFTIVFVYQSSQGVGTGTDFWSGAGLVNGEVAGTTGDFGTSLNANGQILAGTGSPDTTIRSSSGYNNGPPHVVTFKRTRSTGALALYVDGTLVAVGTGGTQSLTAPDKLTLGAQQVLNNYFTGDLAEVQIYDSALSDTDRLGYERALKCKYGLSGAATPLAPPGLTAIAGNRQIFLNWTMVAGTATYDVWRYTNNGPGYVVIASGLTGSSFVDSSAANGQTNYYKITGVNGCGAGAFSAVASVLLPLPALTSNVNSNALTLTWPGWANDWQLYTTTNLAPPVFWWLVTNSIGSNNGVWSVALPTIENNRFFRLSSP